MKMLVRKNLHFVLMVISALTINCARQQTAVGLADVCRAEDKTAVEIRGFLHISESTPNLPPKSALLVEHRNGTGGFIKILLENAQTAAVDSEVKVIGKVLKEENSCVLKVEQIETP